MDYADNDGYLSHRDLECCRQYICWAGTMGKAWCLWTISLMLVWECLALKFNEKSWYFSLMITETVINNWSKKKETTVILFVYICCFFCASDWGSAADPPIFEVHDQIWDPCCYDWWICHNRRQCHGRIHLIWGEMKLFSHHNT